MLKNILMTKLFIPATRKENISRPHLIEKLNLGIHHRLTLVSAPAGFGKSTIICEWIKESEINTAWISLDEGDNDQLRFLKYFVEALQSVEPEAGLKIQQLLQAPHLPSPEVLSEIIINDLVEVPSKMIIVLDDYHIVENQDTHRLLAMILDYLPPQIHLVICTRSDPFLPISRFRAKDQITEVREKDLRFSEVETTQFLEQSVKKPISSSQVSSLQNRTEGWIAGLQLAALSLKDHSDYSAYIEDFSGNDHFIMDYLVDEVLSLQSEEVQDFLLRTSILNRFTGSLCDHLIESGNAGGQSMIEYLERSNMFIISLDSNRQWYRYHHLFSEILLSRLKRSKPETIETLYRLASEWFEQNGFMVEAVQYAMKAGMNTRAAILVEQNAMDLLAKGELHKILHFYNLIPVEIFRTRQWLCLSFAWALMFRGMLNEVEKVLEFVDSDDKEIQGNITAIRAYNFIVTGKYKEAAKLAKVSKDLLSDDNYSVLSTITWVSGYVNLLFGKLNEALDNFREVIRLGHILDNPWTVINGMTDLANVYIASGKLRLALSQYREAIEFSETNKIKHFGYMGRVEAGLALVLYEMNELPEASEYALSSVSKVNLWENPNHYIHAYNTLAQVQITIKEYEDARKTLDQADKIIRDFPVLPFLKNNIEYSKVRLWLASNRKTDLNRWLVENSLDDIKETPARLVIIHVRILINQNKNKEALNLLAVIQKAAEEKMLISMMIELLILKSLSLKALEKISEAVDVLKKALALAEPEGHIRIFINEGKLLKDLLVKIVKSDSSDSFSRNLISQFDNPPTQSVNISSPDIIESLSSRELEVLRYLKTDLKGPEIADQLYISLSTVRTHTKNIFEKLCVNNRRAAVTRAKELGI